MMVLLQNTFIPLLTENRMFVSLEQARTSSSAAEKVRPFSALKTGGG
jgi:hypothetical protein